MGGILLWEESNRERVFYNELLDINYEHMDPVNMNMDLCAKVKVYKA